MRYLLAMLLMALGSSAQAAEAGDRYWVEPGLMIGNPGFGAYSDLRYGTGDYVFALGASEQDGDEEDWFCSTDCDYDFNQKSIYALVGKKFELGGLGLVAQTGLARVKIDFDDPARVDENGGTMGIPVRVTKYFGGRYVGFALSVGFTWTDIQSSGYISFGLPIGKLK